jgi:hypothetical protein
MTRALLFACLLAAAGCDSLASEFLCSGSQACRLHGVQGMCETDGHCSFPDAACPSMRRYSDYSGRLSDVCVGSDSIPATNGVMLAATWFGEEQSAWAGPAAGRIALSTRTTNLPTQQTLATFMSTTTTSGTDNVGLVKNALNYYLHTAWFQEKLVSDPPTQAERDLLKSDILLNLNNGYPLVANVVSGTFRPPGYPAGNIYHYVAIIGYDSGGDRVLVSDPGAMGFGGAGWEGVPETYWVATSDLGTWVAGKGYAA